MSESLLAILQNDPNLRLEVETIGEATYYGFTRSPSASFASSVWMIARVVVSGAFKQTLWAGTQKFDQIWNNRVSLFANPPFSNVKSIRFNATDSNDILLLQNHASISFTHLEALSISAWFRTGQGGDNNIFSKQGATNAAGYRLSLGAGRIEWHMSGGAAGNRQEVTSPLNTYNNDNWHHIVIIKPANADASQVLFVVDGSQVLGLNVNSNNLTSSPANGLRGQISGRNEGTTNPFSNGFLDEIAIWRTALTVAEAQAVFNSGLPGNLAVHAQAANMPGWWRMGDNDTFPTITNIGTAGAANNGTMTNMKASDIVGETAHVP